MTADRTTKVLLATIALGLWVQILTPMFRPAPVTAQDTRRPVDVNITKVAGAPLRLGYGLPVEGASMPDRLPVVVEPKKTEPK